jgi:hypothetical protein
LAAKLRDSAQRAANGIGHDYLSSATLCNRMKTRTKLFLELEIRCSIRLSYGRKGKVKWHKPKDFARLCDGLFPRRLDVKKSIGSFIIERDPPFISDQIHCEA